MKGLSKPMKRVMKGCGIQVHFRVTDALRHILVRPKDKVIRERVVRLVYQISRHLTSVRCEDLSKHGLWNTEAPNSTVIMFQDISILTNLTMHHIYMSSARILEVEPKCMV